ncbi:uncharacterized protein LOC131930276 [Physella acuta]|uniref:uncharacterized protein LOC131930276 n=1 Tax=Physella acuta TaxID=109671 RepID=UPI0027DD7743|nr:uncharacterized protein LOC131930276 [Physella acuta]
MEEVKAFKLPENGHPVQSLLERGAEIYRNRPKVNWNPKENGTYSLIIFDVGLLVLRGAWYDIQYANGLFRGQDDFFYRPPANPLPVVNPILVILMKQEKKLGAFSSLGLGVCSMRIILPYVSICRGKFSKFIGDGSTVVGLQVFYTDGASMFEKYRVCVEGYICDTQCVDKFREYASNKLPQIQFMNLDVSTIDTYVNIRYETKISGPIGIRCCSSITHRAIFGEKRAVPGDDLKVSCYDVLCGANECHSTMDTEMSSTEKNWKGDNEYSTFYAFVPHLKDGKLEVKFIYLLKNNHINARSRNVTEDKELYYSEGVGTRHMYMLLFTHPNLHKDTPTVSADNKLIFPGDFKLRGMSWILFDHNHLTFMDTECEGNTRTCPPTEEDTPKDSYKINITYTETSYETPTESTTNPVTSCLQKKPPPPPPPPPPPNKSSKTLADVNSVVSV